MWSVKLSLVKDTVLSLQSEQIELGKTYYVKVGYHQSQY